MVKLQISNFLLLSKRSYAVATESLNVQPLLSVMRKAQELAAEELAEKKVKDETFWMRDPKTGNWIPESHFGEIDAADLRRKFLSRKEKILD
ncbi:protein SENESCENCE-ASSOCIATED GENE 21, mitochondrial [Ricinus communis]|uniref:Late embryogenesis abundant protein Lea5 n=1 Tax=Ricinus communis TaxID=3988 RepID=B9T3Y6_RICCO|nr:protein SENESCENCE-ASSOCIATED GENE 21, mitochondrial [Ricinus communis]EEF29439.1 conserved hypothetical protein [Ricinus communis]|eukprot:XP_025015530.1 protein SENESCENCE-ASSOCIATED GENE 21, mitochondrial-like [Ricinus communis]